jgi:hypothetical protein
MDGAGAAPAATSERAYRQPSRPSVQGTPFSAYATSWCSASDRPPHRPPPKATKHKQQSHRPQRNKPQRGFFSGRYVRISGDSRVGGFGGHSSIQRGTLFASSITGRRGRVSSASRGSLSPAQLTRSYVYCFAWGLP